MTIEDRFWSLVEAGGGQECWQWRGKHRNAQQAYGSLYIPVTTPDTSLLARHRGRTLRANRVALELFLERSLAPGMYACHRCDNAGCVNPTHLYEGTPADNRQDLARVERAARPTCLRGHLFLPAPAPRDCATCKNDLRRLRRRARRLELTTSVLGRNPPCDSARRSELAVT